MYECNEFCKERARKFEDFITTHQGQNILYPETASLKLMKVKAKCFQKGKKRCKFSF